MFAGKNPEATPEEVEPPLTEKWMLILLCHHLWQVFEIVATEAEIFQLELLGEDSIESIRVDEGQPVIVLDMEILEHGQSPKGSSTDPGQLGHVTQTERRETVSKKKRKKRFFHVSKKIIFL